LFLSSFSSPLISYQSDNWTVCSDPHGRQQDGQANVNSSPAQGVEMAAIGSDKAQNVGRIHIK
jgi:hypothetical protein